MLQAFAELAIDADRFIVQQPRLCQIAGEQSSGGQRAQAAPQGLGGTEWSHERMRLAQETLALLYTVRQQPRRARAQQRAALVKAVADACDKGVAARIASL